MTNPATLVDNTVNVFTAPANTTLAASTTYWLVTSNSASTFGTGFRVATNNNEPGQRHGSGMEPSATGASRTTVNATSWGSSSNRHRFQIRGTEGTPPPTPPPR